MGVERVPDHQQIQRDLVRRLTSQAELTWGAERARELTESIELTARTLALVGATSFLPDDAEPDFIQ